MDTLLNIGLSNALIASVLAIVAAAVSFRCRCRRPALVHGLWLLVLLKLVTPPLLRVPIVLPAAPTIAVQHFMPILDEAPPSIDRVIDRVLVPEVVPPEANIAVEEPPLKSAAADSVASAILAASSDVRLPLPTLPWNLLLLGVWLFGSAAWFLLAGWRVVKFRRLLRYARPASVSLQHLADGLANDMGLTASPPLWLVPGRLPPMLWAVGTPRLLLPAELLSQVNADQLEGLLAHELAHLRRRDHWVRALEFITLGLYWWLPIVWYARRQLREAEEQCCDAWVVSMLPGSGKTYAHALLETLDFLSHAPAAVPVLASGIGQVSDLKRRLRMIVTGQTPRALTWRGIAGVVALGLFLLPFLPTWVRGEPATAGEESEQPPPPRERRDPPKPEEVEKAKAELKQLHDEINRKAADIVETAKKMHEIHMRLGRGEGRPPRGPEGRQGPPGAGEPHAFILRRLDDKWVIMPAPPGIERFRPDGRPGEDGPRGRRPGEGRPPRPGDDDRGERRPPPPGRDGRRDGGDRIEQLERHLEAVMRQLEEIRRELGSRRGPGPAPAPERGPGPQPRPERKPPQENPR